MLPDLESLRCFDAVARHLNFRTAAAEVALSPAAFSDRIRRLEDQLGAPLLARTTRRVSLTEAGQKLMPQARRCLAEARQCMDVMRGTAAAPPFELRIGTRFELGLSWLVPALPVLEKERSSRSLQLTFGGGPELLRLLDTGLVDGVITSARLNLSSINYGLLHEEHYVLVASPRSVRKTPLARPEDAARHTLLDITPDLPLFRYFLDAGQRDQSWEFQRIELLGTIGAVRLRLLQGVGVAVLPRYSIEADLKAGRLVTLLPKVKLRTDWFRLVWKTPHPREGDLRQLAQELARLPLR